MKLAIIISTYYRKDGRSSSFLTRALNSIANQTYQDYKIFLTPLFAAFAANWHRYIIFDGKKPWVFKNIDFYFK